MEGRTHEAQGYRLDNYLVFIPTSLEELIPLLHAKVRIMEQLGLTLVQWPLALEILIMAFYWNFRPLLLVRLTREYWQHSAIIRKTPLGIIPITAL
jgi:hypothetical protein